MSLKALRAAIEARDYHIIGRSSRLIAERYGVSIKEAEELLDKYPTCHRGQSGLWGFIDDQNHGPMPWDKAYKPGYKAPKVEPLAPCEITKELQAIAEEVVVKPKEFPAVKAEAPEVKKPVDFNAFLK